MLVLAVFAALKQSLRFIFAGIATFLCGVWYSKTIQGFVYTSMLFCGISVIIWVPINLIFKAKKQITTNNT